MSYGWTPGEWAAAIAFVLVVVAASVGIHLLFVDDPPPPPHLDEVCSERGGVRNAVDGNGWSSDVSSVVVCMDGYATTNVRIP